jgi:hypothetical protein
MSESEIYFGGYNFLLKDTQTYCFPVYTDINKYNIFFRGIVDRYGNINRKTILNDTLICEIAIYIDYNIQIKSILETFLNTIKDLYNINYNSNINTESITTNFLFSIKNYDALIFLNNIYDNSDARYRNIDKYTNYINWLCIEDKSLPYCKFRKIDENAITPFKQNTNDVGYTLNIIKLVNKLGNRTFVYDTGIIIVPKFGYYIKIISNIKLDYSGFILNNSVYSVYSLDSSYKDSIKVVLTKIDEDLPELELPFSCIQLIIEKYIHYTLEEITNI